MLKKPVNDPETVSAEAIKTRMKDGDDTIYTEIVVNDARNIKVTVVFIDGMVNADSVYDFVLKPLTREPDFMAAKTERHVIDAMMRGRIYHGQRKICETMTDALDELLFGAALVVFDNEHIAIAFDSKGFDKRGISEPTGENVLKGSKEAFVEVLRVNTAMVRRRLLTSDLKIRQMKIGRRSNTTVAVVYIDGIANSDTVKNVIKRLEGIDIDGVVSAGQIESALYENHRTIFPQALYTERPDRFAGNIIEGRIGIIIDGMPITYITPIDIHALLQAAEDYSSHYIISSFFRTLRYICAFVSLTLPATYVAITTFHQEMIPTKLAVAIISSKQGVPLPTYIEVLLMLLAFEVLIEAGLRLPQSITQAVSIVGALVVGQAAIAANLLSPGVVIIIAVSGMSGFVVTSQDLSNALRLLRLLLVLASMVGGLFTVTAGLIIILYMLCRIEVFGTPYLSPFAGSEGREMLSDTIVRRSWNRKMTRPANIKPEDMVRQRKTRSSGIEGEE